RDGWSPRGGRGLPLSGAPRGRPGPACRPWERDATMSGTMTASEVANLPRWCGDAGFVEIWFLVVFHPPTESALWLRYTTFAPAPGAVGAARAIVWAAWFD